MQVESFVLAGSGQNRLQKGENSPGETPSSITKLAGSKPNASTVFQTTGNDTK